MSGPVAPLAPEDHVCDDCQFAYAEVTVESAAEAIASVPDSVHAAVAAIPSRRWGERPSAGVWSVAEYVCHLRDVYATYTIRLHRARTEDRPAVEPMLNDLRARRFGYNDWNVHAAVDELAATSAGFRTEIGRMRPDDWDRTIVRLDEQRSARWLVRQAAHEGVHHVADIRRVGRLVTAAEPPTERSVMQRTASFRVSLPVADAMALFTPEGERAWAGAGWDPRYPAEARTQGPGAVFTTDAHGQRTLWVMVDHDETRVRYARVTPGVDAGTVTVTAVGAVADGTAVEVAYDLTALSPAGASKLDHFDRHYDSEIAQWADAIRAALHSDR